MARKDLGKIICEITDVNATVDSGVGIPFASATITGTLTEKTINFDFKNLKGDKPIKGTDYLKELTTTLNKRKNNSLLKW